MKITKRKKIATVTCVALLVAFGITMFAVGGAQGEDSSAKKAVETIKEDPTATVKEVAENVNAAKVEPEEKTAEKDAEETAKEEATTSDANNSGSSSNGELKSNSSNSSKPSNSDSKSSTKHSHDWVAVYATKQVQVGTERKAVDSYYICNKCKAVNPDGKHLIACNSSEATKYVYEDVPIYEEQSYIKGYKCSCGATK